MTDIFPEPRRLAAELATSPESIQDFSFETKKITAADQELWLKMGQLRGLVYLGEGFISPDTLDVDGAEFDVFDDRSDHFVALADDGEMIGTVRVVNRGEDAYGMLPAEEEFECELPERTQEISRFIHTPELTPSEGLLVSLALMRAAYKATSGKSDTIYAVVEDKLHRQLSKHVGIELRSVAPPRVIEKYRGTTNHLVEMQPQYITSQVYKRDVRVRKQVEDHPSLQESLLGKPYAPFFERHSTVMGLGRVSLADFTAPNPDQFDRNLGFLSPEQQEILWNSTVAIAGAGGDGGQVAIGLARNGIRHFKLADPEVFAVENLNRQAGATYATIGHNKAEVVADILRSLGATVDVYPKGITSDNVTEFVSGSDLVIDETEYTMPQLGVMLAREARQQEKSVLMGLNVGFGSFVNSFDPKGMTFEKYLGLDEAMTLEEIEQSGVEVSIDKWVPHIPSYANIGVFKEVAREERSTPTVVEGVYFVAGDVGTQTIAHLLSRTSTEWANRIKWAPQGNSMDAIDGSRVVRSRSFHFKKTLAVMAIRNHTGHNQL